jgi:hypothetical protein
MYQLMMTVIAIVLTAAIATATIVYTPGWKTASDDAYMLARTGVQTLENAFTLATQANGGTELAVDLGQTDGGLAANFANYYRFLPKAPAGYSWKYGYSSATTLTNDSYAGNGANGLYWFCLYPSGTTMSQGVYKGFARSQKIFSGTQFYLHDGGSSFCGRAVNSAEPTVYPNDYSVTFFVRYVSGN